MSCITESLARGLAKDAQRDSKRRHQNALRALETLAPNGASAIWRETLDFARGVSGHVIYERHQGEKKRATADLVCMEKPRDQAMFYIASLSARKLMKMADDYVVNAPVYALISGHAQHRAIQALGPDPKVYGRELFKHAAAVAGDTSVAATFGAQGIVIWERGVAKTFIPSDRLDKWAAPYARWQSGKSVDGVVSAAGSMAEALAMVGGEL